MKLKMILILTLASLLLAASVAQAEKLLCVSQANSQGDRNRGFLPGQGGKLRSGRRLWPGADLDPEEVESDRAFNPKVFDTRAFSVKYFKEAPDIPPLPVSPPESGSDPSLPLIQGSAGIGDGSQVRPPPPLLRPRGPPAEALT